MYICVCVYTYVSCPHPNNPAHINLHYECSPMQIFPFLSRPFSPVALSLFPSSHSTYGTLLSYSVCVSSSISFSLYSTYTQDGMDYK